jgi:type I restriction enzyme S subunit
MSKAAWKRVKLGEVCRIEKGATGIMKAIPGEYPMVTLAAQRTSHNEYQFDAKAIIVPLVSSTGHGHASMKRIHYQEGKFALGSILCALIPHDEQIVHPHFLFTYLNFAREQVFVPLMRGAANVSLSVKNIASVEILLPPLDEQKRIAAHIERITACSQALRHELATQKTLLAKLREAILREAVQGKLTHQNPADEDARHLLARIKAEKAAKGIKEKPLPPIKPEDIPYQLPQGWVWCRLGETTLYSEAGKSWQCIERPANGNEWGIIKVSAITSGQFLETENKFYSADAPPSVDARIFEGDFIITRASGSLELVGKSVIVKGLHSNLLLSDKTIRFVFSDSAYTQYINLFNTSAFAREYFKKIITATSTTMKNLTREQMYMLPIPLPPLAEQQRIVAAVERLLERVSVLEREVLQEQETLGRLMQSALREAFGSGTVENERGDEHEI